MTEERIAEVQERLASFLRDRIEYDEKDGTFYCYVYASYDDAFSNKDIEEILLSEDPELRFHEAVEEGYNDYVWELRDEIADTVMGGLYPSDEAEENEIKNFLNDLIWEKVEFVYPYDHYMDQVVNADLMIDTGDGNYDYGCNSVYPHYAGEPGSGIQDEASLVWLAETQGYSKKQLENALDDDDIEKPGKFLESVRQEVANESSLMNCLTFLVKMTVKELIRLNALIKLQEPDGKHFFDARERPDCGTLKISRRAHPGLYDPWYGAGSLFEIDLEKDIILPIKYIRSCLPDSHFKWSVYSVYGMMSSAWQEDLISEVKGPEVKE